MQSELTIEVHQDKCISLDPALIGRVLFVFGIPFEKYFWVKYSTRFYIRQQPGGVHDKTITHDNLGVPERNERLQPCLPVLLRPATPGLYDASDSEGRRRFPGGEREGTR